MKEQEHVQSKEQVKNILHAIKNGVVPEDTSSFRVGREAELNEFDNIFNHILVGNGMAKFIVGEYGSGKSFMLREVQEKAWDQNFVVAKIQMEKGFRLNNFQTLYYQIMHSLTTRDSEHNGTSFQDLFNCWIDTLKSKSNEGKSAESIQQVITILNQYNLSFSRALLFYIRARIKNDHEMADAITSWMTGEQNIPATVKKNFEVVGHIDHDNAVHFLQAFVKLIKLLGYSGLVILIDELELVMSERSDVRLQAYQNLRYIIDNCYNEQFSHCLFVFGATKDWLNDEEKGPKIYPALYQRIGKGNDSTVTGDIDIRQPIILLNKLSALELLKLTQNIVWLYRYAYEFKMEIHQQSIIKWMSLEFKKEGLELEEVNIRLYLKKLVEVLDILEQNPESQIIKSVTESKSKNAFVQKVFQMFSGGSKQK